MIFPNYDLHLARESIATERVIDVEKFGARITVLNGYQRTSLCPGHLQRIFAFQILRFAAFLQYYER